MSLNIKACGECGAPQAIAFDGCPHCTKCETDMFPAGAPVHPANLPSKSKKVVEVQTEEDDETEE